MAIHRFESKVTVLALAALAIGLSACNSRPAAPSTPPRPVLVAVAKDASQSSLGLTGTVRAEARAVVSVTAAARVQSVAVDLGDQVRRGQLLLRVDTTALDAALLAAKARLAESRAQANEASTRFERAKKAASRGAISVSEVSALEASADAAAAQHAAALAALTESQWRLDAAMLRAPIDGTIARRLIEPGQVLAEGTPVLEIDGAGREIVVDLPATMALTVQDQVPLNGPTGPAVGVIKQINERIDVAGIRRAVISAPASARVGDVWSVRPMQSNAAVLIPLRAVQRSDASATSYVLRVADASHVVARIPVRIGAPEGDQIAVLEGLKVGDQVVIAGALAIADGTRVNPVSVLR